MIDPDAPLEALGLHVGDRVRYRRRSTGHWHEARVERREKDGSIGVRDARGASRALTIDRLELKTTGPRGARAWIPVADIAARTEQLKLL